MTTLRGSDRPAVVVTGLVAVPVAVGLLWSGATAPDTSDALVTAVFLVAWLVLALPVAVLVGRRCNRDDKDGASR